MTNDDKRQPIAINNKNWILTSTSKKFINLWKSSILEINPSNFSFGVAAFFIAFWADWTLSSVSLSPIIHALMVKTAFNVY